MSYMGEQAQGWAVVEQSGINMNTVYSTRQGAIVNWLVTTAKIALSHNASPNYIEMMWSTESVAHRVAVCQVEVRVLAHD